MFGLVMVSENSMPHSISASGGGRLRMTISGLMNISCGVVGLHLV
jgi:hypothetical protein